MANVVDISDNRMVVCALKTGNEAVFKAVYMAHYRPLHNYARTILQDEEAAYEIVQDIFASVWLNRKKLDDTKSLRNYLLRAVHNNALRRKQSDAARRRREDVAASEMAHHHENDDTTIQGLEMLAPAIARLPQQSRKVLEMSYWENKKNAAIASELSISIRTVETILYKVVKKLRGEIKKTYKPST